MFRDKQAMGDDVWGFRPLAGCGLFHDKYTIKRQGIVFPSPCGVWVVSMAIAYGTEATKFPSPCGVWVVSLWQGCGA